MYNLLDVMSIIGSILMIVGIIFLTYYVSRWYARRLGAGGMGRYIKIVDRANVTRTSALVITEVNGKHYLLGVTEKGINMLSEVEDPAEFAASNPAPDFPQQSFSDILKGLTGKSEAKKKQDDGGPQ